MCGIFGFFSPRPRSLAGTTISQLMHRLSHRGPDDQGWLSYSCCDGVRKGHEVPRAANAQVLLGHRRLSIIDLSSAAWQPMSSADGNHHVVLNGEIYNYLELRKELESLGHVFHSSSDTEVLLEALTRWGKNCLPRLTGMFAFAYLDIAAKRLLLVRDAFGIKPLYYRAESDGFVFASEIPALLKATRQRQHADPQRIYEYLRFGLTDFGADTMFAGIKQLEPGHYLELALENQNPVPKTTFYWQLDIATTFQGTFEQAAAAVQNTFLDSVRLHLRSDVPVGSALSGGIDSSAIVCAAKMLAPHADLHVFGFFAGDSTLNEEQWCRQAATAADAKLREVRISAAELAADLSTLIGAQGEPFSSTSIYAQYRVFQAAREAGIKVMLDGQGADELLAGYLPLTAARIASLLRQHRWLAATRLFRTASRLPGRDRLLYWLGQFYGPRVLEGFRTLIGEGLYPSWLKRSWFEERRVQPSGRYQYDRGQNALKHQLRLMVTRSSLPMLLRYEDRNSMAHSIESRVPFLTTQLAELVLGFPEEFIVAEDGRTKAVFRKAMNGIVPASILERQDKIGFITPERDWLKLLSAWVLGNLAWLRETRLPIFNYGELASDWQNVNAGKAAFDWRIWRWNNLAAWINQFDVVIE